MRGLLTIVLLLVAMSTLWGQDLPKKVAVLDNSSGDKEFVTAFEMYVAEISTASNSVRGFIALSGTPGEIMPRYKFIRSRMRDDEKLKTKLEVTQPGAKYRGTWKTTEFWFLAKDAPSPYQRETADYACPSLELKGENIISEKTENVLYSVNYPTINWLDTPYTFKWSVSGGKILTGQGTTTITVERIPNKKQPIVVSVEVGGGDDEDRYCTHTASMTTEIGNISRRQK